MRSSLDKYQSIIKKREELRKYITEKISIFQSFIEDRNKQISDLIEENKLKESSIILNESLDDFNHIFSDHNEIFYITLDELNRKYFDFPKYFSLDVLAP